MAYPGSSRSVSSAPHAPWRIPDPWSAPDPWPAPEPWFTPDPWFLQPPYAWAGYPVEHPLTFPVVDAWRHVPHAWRQAPAHAGGPERITERPPRAHHIDWHARYPNDIILHGPTDRKAIALTFDDGPDDVWTPQILRILAQYQVKATFFCVGQRVQQSPRVLQQIYREGHVVGNHSWSHPNLTRLSPAEVRAEVERTSDEIQRLLGVRPYLFRPPYGALSDEVIREVVAMGYKIVFWNVDSLDWAGLTGPQVAANVLAHAGPGAIVLMHSAGGTGEGREPTVQSLPYIIVTLRRFGYTFVTVPELTGIPAYQPQAPG
ncbi:hypothetical protein GCM10010885_12430 [Alicyclobacillus cellulosilyticus]|uniref:NodB homology domain-containing protein n=1 Tax=Alicyclobacillus cellulosilyticus TaxID=1003997 RepID=A0A917KBX5_9BACL|nr:polysaccharide deacetylase family protein [Alicyclobacillus cellulosilyticus]GGJ04803.1 hypothetical protein GCM10010885_12430 [Alicyclobacillus cellulosilyticus]